MSRMMTGKVSKLENTFLNISNSICHLYHSLSGSRRVVPPAIMIRIRAFSSLDRDDGLPSLSGSGTSGLSFTGGRKSRSAKENVANSSKDDGDKPSQTNPPDPIPNRALRVEKPIYQLEQQQRCPRKIDRGGRGKEGMNFNRDDNEGYTFDGRAATDLKNYKSAKVGNKAPQSGRNFSPSGRFEEYGGDFLEKFKLGFDKGEKDPDSKAEIQQILPERQLPPPQDTDDIFKKMKETGLIPNAVAMLHGLCQDGLVKEAMQLFGLMRENGTIPEVVIYTAVVEGFCKAQKLDDAKRIFRKMQNNGISPNAFSYGVLIQGLYQSKSLDDALGFCVEMLEAGHSPNLATFTGLIDHFCKEKGLKEAQSIIATLKQKGFYFDERVVREYLDKKGPFLPLVWEAILGKKSS